MEHWQGKVALVTGASVGIGAAVCLALVKRGMTVVGCARRVEQITAISQETAVKSSPGKLVAKKCNVREESEILKLFDEIRSEFGRIDILINNAGLAFEAPLIDGRTSDWKNMIDVNVMALCICNREAIKLMKEKNIDDGHIINVSSIAGHRLSSMKGVGFYTGTKFMVRALTEGLRRELKAEGSHIRIGSVSPGMVETEFLSVFFKNNPERQGDKFYESFKALQSEDIADSIIHILASPPHVEIHDIIVRPREQAL